MPPIRCAIQLATTLSPPMPVKRHHLSTRCVSVFGNPVKEVDVKARLRHGSVMLVYPSQEPAGKKETLAIMLI